MKATCFALAIGLIASSYSFTDDAAKTEKVSIGPASYEVPGTWVKQKPVAAGNLGPIVQYGIPLAKEDDVPFKVQLKVYYFQGGGGTIQSNVNRWVDMFEETGRDKKIEDFESDGFKVKFVDIKGDYKDKPFPMSQEFTVRKGFRMLAAIVETPSDGPYFFRTVGPEKTMAGELENFKKMVKNVKKGA